MMAENKIWFGESREERTDDNSNCLYLRLNSIEIKRDGKSISYSYKNEIFLNPPTKKVQTMRELLELLCIEVIPHKDFQSSLSVIVKVSEQTQFIHVKSSFWSKWYIMFEGSPYGVIKETGNFCDIDADIIIDVPRYSY